DAAIYLPVILSTENGFECFSSSHFYHNPQTTTAPNGEAASYFQHEDFILFHDHIYHAEGGLKLDENGEALNQAVALDLSITKSVAGMFLVIIIMMLLFGTAARKYKKNGMVAPSGLQSFLEPLVLFVRDDIARPSIGPKADKFVPFL